MSKFMRENKCKARPHGFRATFRTWVEEQTDTPFEVKEACLGRTHPVSTAVRLSPTGDEGVRRFRSA